MTSGEMRDRITFLKEEEWEGPVKPLAPGHIPYKSVWAKKEYLKGREFWAAKTVNAETTIRFIIRYRSDITPYMKICDGEYTGEKEQTLYNIVAILPMDNKKQWLMIHVNEKKESL